MKLIICSDVHDNFGAFDLVKEDKPLFFCGDVYTNQKLIDLFFGTLFKFYLNKVDKEEVVKQFENNVEEIKKSVVEKEIPEFFKKNGTASSTDAVQITFVSPNSIKHEPSACLL